MDDDLDSDDNSGPFCRHWSQLADCDNQEKRTTKRWLVVAGTHAQFLTWCRDHKLSPMDKRVMSVPEDRADCIRGLGGPARGYFDTQLATVGTHDERSDWVELRATLRAMGFDP